MPPIARAAVLLFVCLPALAADDFVWWEGESPSATNFPKRTWFSPADDRERAVLSGGDWLTNIDKRTGEEAFAKYRVAVPADGEYAFWTRKFWKHGPFRWRFDEQPWQTCGPDVALADDAPLRTHVGANWVHLGSAKLTRGTHDFELRLLAKPGDALTAGFDCFLLTTRPFTPAGKRKPGEKSGKADPGFFPYEPDVDPFAADAVLDLRSLNEKTAGESGFLRADGDRFILGDGTPGRFWAVNVGANNAAQDHGSVDYLARKLAKLGVNMVRFHSPLFDARAADPATVDPKKLDDLQYLVAAMKKQGIYTKISFYFPLWFDIKPSYGIGGYDGQQDMKPFSLLFFNRRMQEIHRAWATALLTTRSPYTGLPLGRDPAVGIVEIINEDSFFFWTFSKKNIPPEQWKALEDIFARWLAAKYGSPARARAAWGERADGDLLLEAWHMTSGGLKAGGAGKRKHVGDQVQFLAEHQRRFFADTASFFKDELKLGGLVSATNWQTADAVLLDALERYTYTAGDVIDRHGYFGGPHSGDGSSYSVRVGHTFADRAAVLNPDALPIQVNQLAGFPHIISEIGWPNPNRFRADCTFLASAYGSLQGIDGFYFFAAGANSLVDQSMNKFALSCPVIAATFPAAALQYRRGDVAEAADAVHEALSLPDLYAMKGSAAVSAAALDELRHRDIPAGGRASGPVTGFDPLAFYVGRVTRTIAAAPGAGSVADLPKYIDRGRKTVRSLTGELAWDYGRGLATVNTPRSQGAAGFLAKAGRVELADVSIESANEYGAIQVISLDGKPLKDSRKILIQVMTEERPYGFQTDRGRITDLGAAPFGVRKIDATVRLKLAAGGQARAVALDLNGYATSRNAAVITTAAGAVEVRPPPDALYTVVTR